MTAEIEDTTPPIVAEGRYELDELAGAYVRRRRRPMALLISLAINGAMIGIVWWLMWWGDGDTIFPSLFTVFMLGLMIDGFTGGLWRAARRSVRQSESAVGHHRYTFAADAIHIETTLPTREASTATLAWAHVERGRLRGQTLALTLLNGNELLVPRRFVPDDAIWAALQQLVGSHAGRAPGPAPPPMSGTAPEAAPGAEVIPFETVLTRADYRTVLLHRRRKAEGHSVALLLAMAAVLVLLCAALVLYMDDPPWPLLFPAAFMVGTAALIRGVPRLWLWIVLTRVPETPVRYQLSDAGLDGEAAGYVGRTAWASFVGWERGPDWLTLSIDEQQFLVLPHRGFADNAVFESASRLVERHLGACPRCGYPTRGAISDRCPECGEPTLASTAACTAPSTARG